MAIYLITVGLIIALLIYLILSIQSLKKHYNKLINVSGKDSLPEILNTILDRLNANGHELDKVKNALTNVREKGDLHIQKVGFVRYNPFSDIGGDQSFVFALLDGTGSGVVLRSLHNRNSTRWFAKNVKEGKGVDYDLTKEESEAVSEVLKKGKN